MLPLLLAACTTADEATPISRPFPNDFAWGTAVAGFQVDMGCPTRTDCVDDASDWYQWVTDPTIIAEDALYVTGQPLADGPGMWELFEDDVARMKADHLGIFRMSFEWSRLFPTSTEDVDTVEGLDDRVNAAAVTRYHEMLAALRSAGIKPIVTVNHYTLPLWVHDGVACHVDLDTCPARGWVDKDRLVPLIARYAGWVAREFGGEVDQWATLNEPFATTASGYLQPGESRSAPPGRSFDAPSTVASLIGQIEAHAAMYDAIHAYDMTAEVGIVMNMVDMVPFDASRPQDVEAMARADHLYHGIFVDALTSGDWDSDLDGNYDTNRPELANRLDYLGINYYNLMTVGYLGLRPLGDLVPAFDFLPSFDWTPHPEGLGAVVERARAWDVPLWITENGTPEVDAADTVLDGHLTSLWDAIDAGADVRGYMYWSYVDNYEWNHGLDMRFGLYGLDPSTKDRLERPVAARYRQIASQNGLE